MEIGFGFIYSTIFVIMVASYFIKRKHMYKRGDQLNGKLRLPPGSMGLPYVGETLQLYSQDPNVFFTNRQKRYGEIFKTHVLGCPCVMLASPEAARFVLVTQTSLFKPTYPRSKERMIGPSALFFKQGDYHMRIRKLVQSCLAPDALRAVVPEIERIVVSMLESLGHGQLINTFHTMKKLSFDVGILTIFGGKLEANYKAELKKNYFIVDKGYNSFPTNIPGTLYNKAIKARKRLSEILSEIMNERRNKGTVENDMLSNLMESKDEKGSKKLSDEQISDNIIGVLFAAQDTTASVLTWILKYLAEDPKLLEAVKVEQMAIHEINQCGCQHLTWAQTRSMTLTNRVILETLRMASIISFTFREAVADVEYKGFLIPKGWKVMPLFRNIHHNPDFFPEPHNFEPSRFSRAPKPNTFLPFGSGVHACPGNELAKLQILILVHHLVTKYRFEVVEPHREIEYAPFPIPKHGLPARLWRAAQPGPRG